MREAAMRHLAPWFVVRVFVIAAAFLAAGPALHAQSTPTKIDPDRMLLGVWTVDLARSRYYPGPPPVSETRTFTRDKDGVKGTVVRRLANGTQEMIEYRADFDQEYPVSGTEAYDAVRFRRIDAYTADAVLSHAGRVYGTARRVISPDGKTMTITFRQEDESLVKNLVVYRKEP
jgi:hypothetical protein